MEREEELRWVARLRDGKPEAFDAVYRQYRPRIFGFLARLCGQRPLAEDLLQETFLRLARFAPRLREDTRLDVFLFTVARNVYRSHQRWAFVDMDRTLTLGQWALSEPAEPSPFDMRSATELQRQLDQALRKLSVTYREALLLVAVQRMDTADAAQVLGISVEALRQRLSRGRKLLAAALEEEQPRGRGQEAFHGA